MLIALDTNILVYAEGFNGEDRQDHAKSIIAQMRPGEIIVPVQVLSELFAVQIYKLRLPAAIALTNVTRWANAYTTIETSKSVLAGAMELAGRHRIAFWDAVVMASAAEAGCRELLCEDFQPGFTWRGVTIRNPFAAR